MEDSRTRILQAALTLFDRFGYAGTSMDDIRKAAGFRTKSSIYSHFPGKETLSMALFEQILANQAEVLGPFLVSPDEARLEDLLNVSETLAQWGLRNQPSYRFCFVHWHQDRPSLHRPLQALLNAIPQWAVEVLSHLQATTDMIRPWAPDLLVTACQGLINQIIVAAPPQLADDDIQQRARQIRELCEAIVRQ